MLVSGRFARGLGPVLVVGSFLFFLQSGDWTPAGAASLAATATQASQTLTFNPIADTFTSSASPDQSFGSSTRLSVDRSTKEACLKFDLSGLSGAVVSAELRIYPLAPTATGASIAPMSDTTWSESVTYNTRPAIDGVTVATTGAMPVSNQWYSFNVTGAVTGSGLLSLGFRAAGTDAFSFASREAANPPALVVTIGSAVATATVTPAATPSPTRTFTPTNTSTATATIGFSATLTPAASPTLPATATATSTAATATATAAASLTSTVTSSPGAVQPGALTLTATFNSIGVELRFGGDADANAMAALAFKRHADATWRQGLPLWRTNDGSASPGPAFYGSALLLDPGTAYDVRVTVSDPDGVVGSAVLTGSITTRVDNIPATGSLAPTHYVRATGSDANDGATAATAWRTLDKALAASPSGAVVQVGPGYYQAPSANTVRTQPLTLLAQYPAVDDSRTVINAGRHTVVEPAAVSAPSGSGEPNAGVWQPVTLVGPGYGGAPAGATYAVWKWAGSPVTSATQLGYATSHAAAPVRVANWKKDGADLATPAGWAEKLYTNRTYTYGFYAAGADLYLRLPSDLDPNTLYVTAGRDNALALNGPDIRVSGLEIRQFNAGVYFDSQAVRGVVDHCLLTGSRYQVYTHGLQGPPSVYGSDHVVQYNLLQDSSLWSDDPASAPGITWAFIKGHIVNADGTSYATTRLGEQSEGDGVGARGGARRVVVRFNTIDGTFNGVSPGYNAGYDRYAGQDMDVHDNLIRRIADDPLEPDGQDLNFRAWRNRVERSSTFVSLGPAQYGPLYLFRNEVWQTGNDGVTPDAQGNKAVGAVAFKYSGTSTPQARVYVLHNTFWTDRGPDTGGPGTTRTHGGAQFASGGTAHEAFYLRNNVVRMTGYAFNAPAGPGEWDEDYDYLATTDATRGVAYAGVKYTTDVAAYRAATGEGAHTNLSGDFITPPTLRNPTAGDLSLPAGSPLIDAGVPVPNLSDRPGVDFAGNAPDLGAREAG